MSETNNISIIVPMYNARNVIQDLINDVLAQTMTQWELILVDDGSLDDTCEICEKYLLSDNRINLIKNNHLGVSAARNRGIETAKGEWITFVDADDRLLDGFLMSLFEPTKSDENIDIVYCGYAVVGVSSTQINTYQSKNYIGKNEIKELLGASSILYRCSPWAKLFRRSLIVDNNLRFDISLSISEDRLFFYHYCVFVKGIALTSNIGYLYGSFSPTSLKNKHFPLSMLAERQQKMTRATWDMVESFNLVGEQTFLLVEHLMKIMMASMQSAFEDTGFSYKTCKQQKVFFNQYFDNDLYKYIVQTKRWREYLSNNRNMQLILSNKFMSYNFKQFYSQFVLKIKLLFHSIIHRTSVKHTFGKSVVLVNK